MVAVAGGWAIPVGVPVRDAVGEKVGTVAGHEAGVLWVQRGVLLPTELAIDLRDVARYEDGTLHLKLTKAQVLGKTVG